MAQLKLCCPNCKSHNITITTESSVTGGITAHHGGFSTTSMSNNHQNFWICSDCGAKFRNIQNLEEEIKKNKNAPAILFVIAGIALVLTLYLIIQISSSPIGAFLMAPYTVGAASCAIGFAIGGFVSKKKQKARINELEYLKANCFEE